MLARLSVVALGQEVNDDISIDWNHNRLVDRLESRQRRLLRPAVFCGHARGQILMARISSFHRIIFPESWFFG
jgi:hypothetical protein